MNDVPQPRRRLFRPGDVSPKLVPATEVVTTFRLSDTSAQVRVLYRLAGRYPTAPASDGTSDPRLVVGHPADQLGAVVTLVRQVDPEASVTMSTADAAWAEDNVPPRDFSLPEQSGEGVVRHPTGHLANEQNPMTGGAMTDANLVPGDKNERDSIADERDRLGDEREALADARDDDAAAGRGGDATSLTAAADLRGSLAAARDLASERRDDARVARERDAATLLQAAQDRDSLANDRDSAANRRDMEASLMALRSGGDDTAAFESRASAKKDRTQSSHDRAAAADDRSTLSHES